MLKEKKAFKNLPSQTAQQVLRVLDKNWKSFFNASKEYRVHPKQFRGQPRPPRYKRKDGESLVIFTNQQCRIKDGYLWFPRKAGISPIKTRIVAHLNQVRIIPKGLYYVVELVYEKEPVDLNLEESRIVGIDLGLNNIVTIVNNAGLKPAIIKGGVAKSINQFYNKQLAKYKHVKDKQGYFFETKRLQRLTRKRNNKMKDLFHKVSRKIVQYCIDNNFGTIIIGYNATWKQKINLGKKNNQSFVQIPFLQLLNQIRYKSELVGIQVINEGESFTSKCSFLDGEAIKKHETYVGRRITRGLFRTHSHVLINADVNAGYNIIKKAVPNAIAADGIEGVGFHPYSIVIS